MDTCEYPQAVQIHNEINHVIGKFKSELKQADYLRHQYNNERGSIGCLLN